jgi:predicted PurR-regulated permease PerM
MHGQSAQNYFLLFLLLGAAYVAALVVKPFFAPLVLGAVFAVVLQPLHKRIFVHVGKRESLAALSTVAVSIIIVLIPILFVSVQLIKEAQSLYQWAGATDIQRVFAELIEQNGSLLDSYIPNASTALNDLSASIDDYVKSVASWILLNIGTAFSSIAALFLDLFIFLVTLYYLLRDGEKLLDHLVHLSPLNDSDDRRIIRKLEGAVNSVVKGKLAVAVIQGSLAGIGLALFGVPNPVVWGLIAVVVSLIPPVGTALVLVPAILYLAILGAPAAAFGLSLWSIGVTVSDNILGPVLMSGGSDLHPLLVLLSVLGGLILFGPVGLFLGPLTIALLLALLSLYGFIVSAASSR